jgi:transforming growth factor-beta-induced protein
MMQAITIVLTLASVVGSASGFATSAPQAFGRPVTSLYMAKTAKPAAKKPTPKPVLADIVDTAVAAGSFNTLAAALGAADLVATLKSKGPFTVFAPTDEAFAKLPEGTIADLLKPENKAKLAAILTYHVLAGEVMASTVVTMDGKTAATVNGASVTIGVKDGTVTVDDAKVLTTDIKTSNGVIHIIDSVMIPKPVLADIVDTAVAAGSFNTLAAALGAADLVATLKSKGPFTVFAPTDEAFAKLPEGTVADLLKPENKAKLAAILTYHVLAGEVMASTVVTMDGKTAATVNGASVTIGVKDGTVTVDDAKVLTTDIKTSNGVIHIIDSVLIPK